MRTQITKIGAQVSAFNEDKILILFGEDAPEALEDYSVVHQPLTSPEKPPFELGKTLRLGDGEYRIVGVGDRANEQFCRIGHVCFYFSWERKDLLPGAVQLYPEKLPNLKVGDILEF